MNPLTYEITVVKVSIPDYASLMLPMLQMAGDGREHEMEEAAESLAKRFKVTPEERIEAAHSELKARMADEVLERVKQCPPKFFEQLVVDLLVAMDYGGSATDAQAVGRTGDGGIDGVIKEDKLGLDAVYVQAKRWEGSVGRPQVSSFVGSLEPHRAKKGVFITTSNFTKDALDYVERTEKKIV